MKGRQNAAKIRREWGHELTVAVDGQREAQAIGVQELASAALDLPGADRRATSPTTG